MNVQQGPLLDATLDPGSGHHRSSYPSDFPLPPRSQLGLDIPVHSLSNTRLPPPPTQGGQVFFSSSSDRHYPAQDSAHGANYSASGMPMDGGHQPSSSSGQPPAQTSTGSNNATSTEGPRKESSGVVIACRQWYVPFNTLCASLYIPFCAAVPVKFAAIPLDPYATTASVDRTNANMTQPLNVGALTSVQALVNVLARKGLLTGLPRHRHPKGNAQVLPSQLTTSVLPQLVLRRTWQV
jgi:hypothetical protein